jgi:hypothetical protein
MFSFVSFRKNARSAKLKNNRRSSMTIILFRDEQL